MGCSSSSRSSVIKCYGIFGCSASSSLVLKLNLFLILWLFVSVSVSAESEKAALLQFRDSVSDSAGLLSSWKSAGNHCSWFGILCDSKSRVVAINVTGNGNNRGNSDPNKPSLCFNSDEFPLYGLGIRRRTCLGVKGKLVGKLSPSIAKLTELRVLSLPFNGFTGEIPGEIWGSDKLEVVDLEGNSVTGKLPARGRFGKSLRVLNLGFNKIEGEIPSSLSDCKALEILNLAANRLNGTVPAFVGRLRAVHLSYNWLAGEIPAEIGKDCQSLEQLDLSGNFLVRGIPSSLGNCGELRTLMLYSNMLEESLPEEIGRLEKLEILDVSRNMLSGPVPTQLGSCSRLSVLVLSNLHNPLPMINLTGDSPLSDQLSSGYDDFNFFQGAIPEEVAALPELKILWAPRATLEGKFPRSWGSCANLEMLNLGQNYFAGEIPGTLAACKKLRFLDIGSNRLSGRLVRGLPVHCMTVFDVSGNAFSGPIIEFYNSTCDLISAEVSDDFPSPYRDFFASKARDGYSLQLGLKEGEFLVIHNFEKNNFTGNFPAMKTLAGERSVYAFLAGENKLSDEFPGRLFDTCGVLGGLIVNISFNWISGPIPDGVGKMCDSLRVLDISGNQISGLIPPSIGGVSLVSLNLSRNSLQGQIPESLSRINEMKYLSLSGNNLTGSIPASLGELHSLRSLDLSSNSLSGPIPKSLIQLGNLTVLLLHNNKLSGQIPSGLAGVAALSTFNVSFNNLSGPLPLNNDLIKCNSAIGNPLIQSCRMFTLTESPSNSGEPRPYSSSPTGAPTTGSPTGRLNSIEIASVTSASAIVSVLLLLVVLFFYTRKWNSKSKVVGSGKKEVTVFTDIGVPLTFESVVRATGSFNASNCIGNGGFGATYKAEVSPGTTVAIKRLAVGRFQGVQQFHAEIKTLGRLHHPNLVTLIGYHASETEMFLIYNYLPGGNLERFIQDRSTRDWRVLHKIALDIARALAYLHDQCVPRVLHRDVKPSNILLDDDYNAHLSDFGLARLLGTSETHATTGVAGTFGYVAPEYAMTCRVSDKADVYSYGVVLLELVSDKKALDPSFSPYGNGFNIVQWACMLLKQGRAREFFTAGLWDAGPHDDLVALLHLAVVCTVDSLSTRPTMRQVVRQLKQLQPPSC